MSRRDAYAWLRETMGLDIQHCHIAMFTSEQCATVVAAAVVRRG